jgi:hypothetical protein
MTSGKFQRISDDEWDKIPTTKPKSKESPWDDAIHAIIDGGAIAIPFEDEKDLRGMRIGIARRASKRFEIKLDFRTDEARKLLAVRLGEKQERKERIEPSGDGEQTKRGPGRPRKQ